MKKGEYPPWLRLSLARLRRIAEARGVRDENDKVIVEGYPTPEDVENELRNAFRIGKLMGANSAKQEAAAALDEPRCYNLRARIKQGGAK